MVLFDFDSGDHLVTSTSLTYSHTVTGLNPELTVTILDTSNLITGVTFNGVAMTQKANLSISGDLNFNRQYVYTLLNPAQGTHNVVISASGSETIRSRSVSYINVLAVDAVNTAVVSATTAINAVLTTIADGCMLVAAFRNDFGNFTQVGGFHTTMRGTAASLQFADTNGPSTPAGAAFIQGFWSGSGHGSAVIISLSPNPAPAATKPTVIIAGVDVTANTDMPSITIEDVLNEQPNTVTLTVRTNVPVVGQDIKVYVGFNIIFGGTITEVLQTYDATPTGALNVQYQVSALDYSFLLNRRHPIGTFVSVAADVVITTIISQFSSGFSLAGLTTGLPVITLTLTGSDTMATVLTNICNMIGYHWFVDYFSVLFIFLTSPGTNPATVTLSNPITMNDPALTLDIALDQIRTQVIAIGPGNSVPGSVLSGDSIIPVTNSSVFNSSGGEALIGGRRVSYASVTQATPPLAVATLLNGAVAGVDTGTHQYAFTYTTAAGNTIASPLAAATTGTVPVPTLAPILWYNGVFTAGSLTVGGTYVYKLAVSVAVLSTDHTMETTIGPALTVVSAGNGGIGLSIPGYGGQGLRWLHVYRGVNGGTLHLLTSIALDPSGNTAAGSLYQDTASDASISGNASPSGSNTATLNNVLISLISPGPSGTTGRKLYRTVAGGSQLKLLHTFADNTTTIFTDNVADASLGANINTTDSSGLSLFGLSTLNGALAVGATTIPLVSIASFSTTGGWAFIGAINIRYTGASAGQLTGVPATGIGSVTLPVPTGTAIEGSPALLGVPTSGPGSISPDIAVGESANVLVQVDNLAAQAALAAVEGGDGVHQFWFTDNASPSIFALTAEANAQLNLFSAAIVTAVITARDMNYVSGRSATIALPAPMGITVSLLIQSVEITHIGTEQLALPQFVATCSNQKMTLQDFLRLLGGLLNS